MTTQDHIGALRGGFVIVGNVPTTDGTYATLGQGALQVLDRWGHVVNTWTDPVFLDGPWDLALDDRNQQASIFVSNVRNGTVARLDVAVGPSGWRPRFRPPSARRAACKSPTRDRSRRIAWPFRQKPG